MYSEENAQDTQVSDQNVDPDTVIDMEHDVDRKHLSWYVYDSSVVHLWPLEKQQGSGLLVKMLEELCLGRS